ncbi:MAG TPA: lytic transglycosylase domain-containing protein [Pyrinomonadaceae bacterium]|nr:lytic transglycosylase domain-containing protein [Pyrinomonadaceae bacterium]
MKFARSIPRCRSVKFAPFAIISVFFFTNLTGFFFSPVLAPEVNASSMVETIPLDIPSSCDPKLDWIIFRAGQREGVDPRFIHAVIQQESRYQTRAISHAGAQGLMQLMPATAKRFGCDDVNDPESNINAGTKYLSWLLKRFEGNVELALAGYNAGEGAVDKYKGIPPYKETQNYVVKIVGNYGKTFHPVLPPEDAKIAFHLVPDPAETLTGSFE